MTKVRLGVNIDHIATLRQVRGNTTAYPDLLLAAKTCIKAGAKQITIHLREDRRHIQDQDVVDLCKQKKIDINLEMAASSEMIKIALKNEPKWVCFVPEKRQELTTEGGLDVIKIKAKLKLMIAKLKKANIKVSIFIEPDKKQVQASFDVGADAVEFHTGKWVLLNGKAKEREWHRLVNAAKFCLDKGLKVHAGHGLDYEHAKDIKKLPSLREVNIGHAIVCYSVLDGLHRVTKKFCKILS